MSSNTEIKALIVDDAVSVRTMAKNILMPEGFEVYVAEMALRL